MHALLTKVREQERHEEVSVLQVLALSCRRLRLLELPHSMPTSVVPVQANGHLCGLRIEGGVQGHRKGLRRRRHDSNTETSFV